mmetsp:Transcript_13936/g.30464  ORF Transcript_13936/g.30464 Transcript_13936/m.30464 type:complete len:80 (-) Transcript_13936:33-272(-)
MNATDSPLSLPSPYHHQYHYLAYIDTTLLMHKTHHAHFESQETRPKLLENDGSQQPKSCSYRIRYPSTNQETKIVSAYF